MATRAMRLGSPAIPAYETVVTDNVEIDRGLAARIAGACTSTDSPRGVFFQLTKIADDDVAVGDAVWFNDTTILVTLVAADNTRIGSTVETAGAATGSVAVRLSGY